MDGNTIHTYGVYYWRFHDHVSTIGHCERASDLSTPGMHQPGTTQPLDRLVFMFGVVCPLHVLEERTGQVAIGVHHVV